MKKYQHWSTKALEAKKKTLLLDIEEWERILVTSKSVLIQLSLTNTIKKAKEVIHAIDAELCYRKHFDAGK